MNDRSVLDERSTIVPRFRVAATGGFACETRPVSRQAKGGLLRHPAQYIVATFFGASLIGTVLLMLPVSSQSGDVAPFTTALFTSTSATCVTGLAVVDTPTYWSGFGQVVILVLIQIGGLGIMTLSSLLVIVLSRRLGIRQRVIAAASTGSLSLGDVRRLLVGIIKMTVAVELAVALVVSLRFWVTHGEPFGRSIWLGGFHSISAFNNAGFALFSDNLISYQTDPLLLGVLSVAIIAGGLGYPVWRQIVAERSPSRWDLHAKITVLTTVVLLLVGFVSFTVFEWTNPRTLGPLGFVDSLSNGWFQSVTTRTAGFDSMGTGGLDDTSHLLTMILMFIGGGSGSTAGGIKVSTFALLGWVMWAEVRGEQDVNVFGRRVATDLQRKALTVALMAVGLAAGSSIVLLAVTPFRLQDIVFESVSALGTVGLSTGITGGLPVPGRLVVTLLMFVGRVGPPTLFAALVLRDRQRLYRYPEERIIIG